MKGVGLIKDILMPPKCTGCGILLRIRERGNVSCLCEKCQSLWQRAKLESCPLCLLPSHTCLCAPPKGLAEKYSIPKVVVYTPSRYNIQSRMVYSLKHVNDGRISRFLSDELALSAAVYFAEQGIMPDECIFTYVPRRWRARAEFGFDQGERLAKDMSRICEGEFARVFVRRGGDEQKKLDKDERQKNIKHAIRLRHKGDSIIKGKCVVIVDDLVTTGATLGYAARLARRAGASRVVPMCVAMTSQPEFLKKGIGGY